MGDANSANKVFKVNLSKTLETFSSTAWNVSKLISVQCDFVGFKESENQSHKIRSLV